VLSATYEARVHGVHSAMPMMRARRMCPQAVVVAPDHDAYARASHGVMEVFRSITPAGRADLAGRGLPRRRGAARGSGTPGRSASGSAPPSRTSRASPARSGWPAPSSSAKLASARCKPDGLLVVPADDVVAFLHPLPVGALWGVGGKTEQVLHDLGLHTVGDLAHTPVTTLTRALGQASGSHLAALAWGRDERSVVPHEPDKSIGAEHTFGVDVDDPAVIARELLRLSERTAARLRASAQVGRTVSIKVRFADFTTITRARTLPEATDVGRVVYETALGLYDALGLERARIRLVGVRVEAVGDAAGAQHQLELGEREHGWRDAEQAVDKAARRFGAGSVRPATLVDPSGTVGNPPRRAQ
jgi:DNA polymerase-4